MKKVFIIGSLLLFSVVASAQIKLPQASVKARVEQVVGLTEVSVDYTRPAKRGRKIFGDLVPYDRIWRTGANENTIISFNEDVTINNKVLPKGKYALYSKPQPNTWTIYFYKATDNWGTPRQWDNNQIALEVQAKAVKSSSETEYLSITIDPVNYNDGKIVIRWDKTQVELPFHTNTHEKSLGNINQKDASTFTARDYYEAAVYLLNTNGDLNKANEYMSKAIQMQPDAPFYMYRNQSLILAKLGKTKEAIKAAEISLEKAQKAGNQDYVKMNQDSISEWKKKK
ncbi:MAG: DUF2911 domain-containing protein [Capnocytophaga sp.]|nr:DUF2911 domain-containing protein [Capnocytophaga sp.]